jgi:hypothetical protein
MVRQGRDTARTRELMKDPRWNLQSHPVCIDRELMGLSRDSDEMMWQMQGGSGESGSGVLEKGQRLAEEGMGFLGKVGRRIGEMISGSEDTHAARIGGEGLGKERQQQPIREVS